MGLDEDNSKRPSRAMSGDAGYDLFSQARTVIKPGVITPVRTGWGVRLDAGEVGLVCPRSGLAMSGVTVVNAPGVIDSGYAGEIVAIMTSLAEEVVVVPGMAVAQLVIVEHKDVHEDGFIRGDRGFGSSER